MPFTSGYTEDEVHLRGDGHTHQLLEKPCSLRALATRVRETLDAPA